MKDQVSVSNDSVMRWYTVNDTPILRFRSNVYPYYIVPEFVSGRL